MGQGRGGSHRQRGAPRPRTGASRLPPRPSRPLPPRGGGPASRPRSAARASRGRVSKVTAPTMELSPYAQGGWRLLGDPHRFPRRPFAALLRAAFRSLLDHPQAGLGKAWPGGAGRAAPRSARWDAGLRPPPRVRSRVRAGADGAHAHARGGSCPWTAPECRCAGCHR